MSDILSSVEFQMSLLLFVALAGYLIASNINQSAVVGIIAAGLVLTIVGGWYLDHGVISRQIGGKRWTQKLFMLIIKIFIPFILFINLVARVIKLG